MVGDKRGLTVARETVQAISANRKHKHLFRETKQARRRLDPLLGLAALGLGTVFIAGTS